MPLDFCLVEPAFAEPFLMEMEYSLEYSSIVGPRVFQMDMGEFDHFEPLWKFLRTVGVNPQFLQDFLILPEQVAAATQVMNSLWPEIHRTRQFFHPDDDPFWALRDLLERAAANGEGLLALCD